MHMYHNMNISNIPLHVLREAVKNELSILYCKRKLPIVESDTKYDYIVGIAVEMEHTDNEKLALQIAKDHIKENPDYYKVLYKSGLIDEPTAINLAKKYYT